MPNEFGQPDLAELGVKTPRPSDFSRNSNQIRMWRTTQIHPATFLGGATDDTLWLIQECQGVWVLGEQSYKTDRQPEQVVYWQQWDDATAPRPSRVVRRKVTADGLISAVESDWQG